MSLICRLEIMTNHTALTGEELNAWRSFYRMRRGLERALDLQLQRDSQISASEYEVLTVINGAEDRQLRIRDIAMLIGWEKSRVSHLVARMEKRELLGRAECPADLRGSLITLTATGRRAVIGASRRHIAAIREYFFDVMQNDDVERLTHISQRVVGAIRASATFDNDSVETSAN
jgi:DNA-binding MarR family transcriptional regulator